MDKDGILASFQNCTGLADMDYCVSILEAHNWNLIEAVAAVFNESVAEMDTSPMTCNKAPLHDLAPIETSPHRTSSESVGSPSRSRKTHDVSTSTKCEESKECGSNKKSLSASRKILEMDTEQARKITPVRILNFDIEIELPSEGQLSEPKVVTESFQFPETETVSSLKQYFIDRRLMELIQLATSPEWESVIVDCTKENLLKYLHLEPSGSHSFDDNNVLLRALHLPKYNKLQAKFSCVPQKNNYETHGYDGHSNQIKFRICLFNKTGSASNGSEDCGHLCLRLSPDAHVYQIRRDLGRLTGIAVSNQSWTSTKKNELDSGNPSDSVMDSLLNELNRTVPHRSRSPNPVGRYLEISSESPSLRELGFKSGDICELTLAPIKLAECSQNPTSSKKLNSEIKNSSDHPMDACPPETGFENKTEPALLGSKNRTSTPSPEGPSDYEDECGMAYRCSSDEMLDQSDENQSTPWNTALIPDTPHTEDPAEATQQFCIVFLQRYCADGVTMAPPFSTCSLENAMSLTVGEKLVSNRKPLFIYVHNDNSVACHVFCQQVLCSPGLGRFLTDNGFSLWPWDVTRPRARERLLGWLEVRLPSLSRMITPLSADSYPLLAMIVKVSGQLEIVCIVLGTGVVKSWPLEPFSINNRTNHKQIDDDRNVASGSLKADVIVAELWQAYTNYSEVLEPERTAEEEQIARRRVREEQEAAYIESLRRDQQKEIERAKAKQDELIQKQLEKERRDREETEATQRRLNMAANLPAEPPCPKSHAAEVFLKSTKGSAGITTLRFRLPRKSKPNKNDEQAQNDIFVRRFAGSDLLKHVFIYIASKGFAQGTYKLLTTFPTRDLTILDENATLSDLNLVPQETLTLELG